MADGSTEQQISTEEAIAQADCSLNLSELIIMTGRSLDQQAEEASKKGFEDGVDGKPMKDTSQESDLFQRLYLRNYRKGKVERLVAEVKAKYSKESSNLLDPLPSEDQGVLPVSERPESPKQESPPSPEKKSAINLAFYLTGVLMCGCIAAIFGYKSGLKKGITYRNGLDKDSPT